MRVRRCQDAARGRLIRLHAYHSHVSLLPFCNTILLNMLRGKYPLNLTTRSGTPSTVSSHALRKGIVTDNVAHG